MNNLIQFIFQRKKIVLTLLVITVAAIGLLFDAATASTAWAQAGAPCGIHSDYKQNVCENIDPKGFYTCKRRAGADLPANRPTTCECRWGEFESGWFNIINWGPGGDNNICELTAGLPRGTAELSMKIIQAVVSFVIAMTVMAGLIILVASGYVYMTAGGDASRVQRAKTWMGAALTGIILSLLGYTILRLIASNLVVFS